MGNIVCQGCHKEFPEYNGFLEVMDNPEEFTCPECAIGNRSIEEVLVEEQPQMPWIVIITSEE
jgi:hypothetical protein